MLKEALINSLSTENSIKNHDMHNMLLYGICTLAFDELTATIWFVFTYCPYFYTFTSIN